MKPRTNSLLSPITVALFCLLNFNVSAQKLPKIQQGSVRAPDNIKIDGKTTEWKDQFQADNHVCQLSYTLSNDNQDLYLTVRMDSQFSNQKVLQGGLTFTAEPLTTKAEKSKEKISITYPAVVSELNFKQEILQDNAKDYYSDGLNTDTLANKKTIDSLVALVNKQIPTLFKEIQVKGISQLAEPLISIYNSDGVKVAARFNNQMKYIYELAVPLKYLRKAINLDGKFKYNIRLNAKPTVLTSIGEGGLVMRNPGNANPDILFVQNPTDFSGEYKLSIK